MLLNPSQRLLVSTASLSVFPLCHSEKFRFSYILRVESWPSRQSFYSSMAHHHTLDTFSPFNDCQMQILPRVHALLSQSCNVDYRQHVLPYISFLT
ncbi:hypothetical protein BR93DRAFT_379061 [Coniochaeta sp. PMI_546]|nr:hypothetical protein BR93DRAFT_379061 [Coniochaeta sp. PMI_546]